MTKKEREELNLNINELEQYANIINRKMLSIPFIHDRYILATGNLDQCIKRIKEIVND